MLVVAMRLNNMLRFFCIVTAILTVFVSPVRGQIFPAIAVESVEIEDPVSYALLIEEANEFMRAEYAVPLFLRAYSASTLLGEPGESFLLSPSLSFDGLLANEAAFASDPRLKGLREQFAAVRALGSKTYLKAVRFDGTNTPGWLFNSLVQVPEEELLLKLMGRWTDTLSEADLELPKLNIFRVIAGDASFTHLVSVNAVSSEHLAQLLDLIAAAGWPLDASKQGKLEATIYRQTLYRELSQ